MIDAYPPTSNLLGRIGSSVPMSMTVTDGMVVANDPGIDDGGTYELIATNFLGRVSFLFIVTVECKCCQGPMYF